MGVPFENGVDEGSEFPVGHCHQLAERKNYQYSNLEKTDSTNLPKGCL